MSVVVSSKLTFDPANVVVQFTLEFSNVERCWVHRCADGSCARLNVGVGTVKSDMVSVDRTSSI